MQTWSGLGRLGKDPEGSETKGGTKMAKFPLAIDEYNHSTKQRETTWLTVLCFGKTAEFVINNFEKGDPIFISNGRVSVNQWVDNNTGSKRTSYGIIANQVDFVPRKRGDGEDRGADSGKRKEKETIWEADDDEDPWGQ